MSPSVRGKGCFSKRKVHVPICPGAFLLRSVAPPRGALREPLHRVAAQLTLLREMHQRRRRSLPFFVLSVALRPLQDAALQTAPERDGR
jgi:hypothetical protein